MRRFTPVNFTDVSVEGDFWRERLDTVLTRTIPSQHVRLVEHGLLDSFDVPQPPPPLRIPRNVHNNFTTQIFWDSDVGKWIEAASYALQHHRDATIEAQIDAITEQLAKAQLPDGYLNCWYIGREIDKRWTNLRDNHELYCAGHMLEGAVAYFQATGRRKPPRYHAALHRPHRCDLRPWTKGRSAAIAGTRRSSSRWSSCTQ